MLLLNLEKLLVLTWFSNKQALLCDDHIHSVYMYKILVEISVKRKCWTSRSTQLAKVSLSIIKGRMAYVASHHGLKILSQITYLLFNLTHTCVQVHCRPSTSQFCCIVLFSLCLNIFQRHTYHVVTKRKVSQMHAHYYKQIASIHIWFHKFPSNQNQLVVS